MSDCIFCRIIAGEIPAARVYQDDAFLAFLDIRPINKGHVLIVPRAHVDRLTDLPDDVLARELPLAKRIASAVLAVTGATDFNLLNSNGTAAGQEVFHHHLHVIPRRPGDGMKLSLHPETYGEGEAADTALRISEALR